MAQIELKSCPFCGVVHKLGEQAPVMSGNMRGVFYVACVRCEAEGPVADSEHEAAAKWNLSNLDEANDLLCSACEIARRKGDSTNWDRFLARIEKHLHSINLRGVSAKTFRLLEDEPEQSEVVNQLRKSVELLREELAQANEDYGRLRAKLATPFPDRSVVAPPAEYLTESGAPYEKPRDAKGDPTGPDQPLKCEVSDGKLILSIGVDTLAFADQERLQVKVTNPNEFAKDVARELAAEREDGSTILTDVLDLGMEKAAENGSAHIG